MSRIVIVSNRLPISIQKNKNKYHISPSAGGLATGLKSYHQSHNSIWIGWPGINAKDHEEQIEISKLLAKDQCLPIFLSDELIENP